jgi:hypothetical protein
MTTITLSLVSHTNVGKTTLARTLLRRDIGEVRDAPHVTEVAERHVLVGPVGEDTLLLWDTPGFGDSVRLSRRLGNASGAIGWFLTEVWDRFTDRAFWSSQQALRHVRAESDLVLYLVNAADPPGADPNVTAELDLLRWLGKPVLLLLNQLGAPRPDLEEAAELAAWRHAMGKRSEVRAVLPLDAFARCWVQEGVLLDAVHDALPEPARTAMARLRAYWRAETGARFEASVAGLASDLARLAVLTVPVEGGEGLPALVGRVAGRDNAGVAINHAERRLATAVDTEIRASTRRLLELHGLDGEAGPVLLQGLAGRVHVRWKADETGSAIFGGLAAGALTGLKADIASGGLTLGGGLIVGSLIGALGGGGLAKLVNRIRGRERSTLRLDPGVLDALYADALLRYLAVAHFGRGRGPWQEDPRPRHWAQLVDACIEAQREALATVWATRPSRDDPEPAVEIVIAARLRPLLADATYGLLTKLYPGVDWPSGTAGTGPV